MADPSKTSRFFNNRQNILCLKPHENGALNNITAAMCARLESNQ